MMAQQSHVKLPNVTNPHHHPQHVPPAPPKIIKSGFLWKKGHSILGQQYKRRLFELKVNGNLDYSEVFEYGNHATKVQKGTIVLSASSSVHQRASDNHKFIIKTHDREWFLWSRSEHGRREMKEWCDAIRRIITSFKSQSVKSRQSITSKPSTLCIPPNHSDDHSTSTPTDSVHDATDSVVSSMESTKSQSIGTFVHEHTDPASIGSTRSDDLIVGALTPKIPDIVKLHHDDLTMSPLTTLNPTDDPEQKFDAKMAKRARRRRRAIEELVSSEKTYVDLMSKLVEHFVNRPDGPQSMLSAEEYRLLFPAVIHPMIGLNRIFLRDLTEVVEGGTFNNDTTGIGKIIDEFCPHFVSMFALHISL